MNDNKNEMFSLDDIANIDFTPSIIDILLDENNDENIVLYDEKNQKNEFEQVAVIPLNGKIYAILKPVNCPEEVGEDEAFVYTTAKALLDKEGIPVYDDTLNGVVIDWDGEFHDESVEDEYDTENEIDIMLMHDIVPVFISCKNGIVTADELYKLNTVAERFGGQYSKKVLVATSILDFGEQGMYLRQRAKDMNIKLIEGVQDIDDVEPEKKLINIWNN